MTSLKGGNAPVRHEAAFGLLSTVGASIIGLGIGVLLSAALTSIVWFLLAFGAIAHAVGMVGTRRVKSSVNYEPAPWERAAYWLCWGLILAGLVYAARRL